MKSYCDLSQCKVLMEFLPLESADMEYMYLKRDNSMVSKVPFVKDGNAEPDCSYIFIPCWSLSALLSVIKPVNGNTYTLTGTLDGGATIEFDDVTNVMYQREEIIDAVYEMVIWLHKEGVL